MDSSKENWDTVARENGCWVGRNIKQSLHVGDSMSQIISCSQYESQY